MVSMQQQQQQQQQLHPENSTPKPRSPPTCMSVGMMASFISTVSAPPMPRSSAVMGSPAGQGRAGQGRDWALEGLGSM